ncbi:SHOCT domain-containing protein [Streptomyces boluensis]|uniref:SHOCT domain-containing protein n=1 Tax=Streptomyces boluensis TaxID=1775135 RepID=A0A964UP33_9ACTN|nr:SHOCT domain-containing protein [Streptomyces boluensis]NBE50447.1 SHOCT domain-containing protein [Streptomyces boluensis]
MQTLAHWDGGPGPWILFFPLIWAAVIVGVVTVLRRTVWRRRGRGPRFGPGGPAGPAAGPDPQSPITVLGHRFASGEIDEDEYWRRLSVLDEQFGRAYGTEKKGGAA